MTAEQGRHETNAGAIVQLSGLIALVTVLVTQWPRVNLSVTAASVSQAPCHEDGNHHRCNGANNDRPKQTEIQHLGTAMEQSSGQDTGFGSIQRRRTA